MTVPEAWQYHNANVIYDDLLQLMLSDDEGEMTDLYHGILSRVSQAFTVNVNRVSPGFMIDQIESEVIL